MEKVKEKKINFFKTCIKNERGSITVFVLSILLVLLLISITSYIGINNKLVAQEKQIAKIQNEYQVDENNMDEAYNKIEQENLKKKWVNPPKLVEGMREVMFDLPEGNNKGQVIEKGQAGFDENNWYNYEESRWANARTEDGSYWVWIPRYAYKITYKNPSNKSEGGTIDVKFLVGTTDQYYDDNGQLQTVKRATSATEVVDTTKDYYVHPAFTNESKINYANGGWDKELTGIWVAKFEAGFASGNNTLNPKASSVKYNQITAWVPAKESGEQQDDRLPARNYLDGVYAVKDSDGNYTWKNGQQTAIKYPTFQPKTYVMNYTSVNDAYNISKVLTEYGNIYGLNSNSTDSHLIKNSEWGAVTYLGYSRYGSNGEEPYINNITLDNSEKSIYAVTGVTTGTTNAPTKTTTKANINSTTGNTANGGVYTWDQIEGQKASNTLNMYGVYDMSGGTWERTTGYIANAHVSLKKWGASVAYDGDTLKQTSTKYTTVYPHDTTKDNTGISISENNLNIGSQANYLQNKHIFGDAVRETSTNDYNPWDFGSWNDDRSFFPTLHGPFMIRSGRYWLGGNAGPFYFDASDGGSGYDVGFRPVLVVL